MNFSVAESRHLLKLAMPILLAQVTQVLMGFVDTLMAGRVSAKDLAAVSIGMGLWLPILLFLQGILLALTSIVAHHIGAKRIQQAQYDTQQGVYLAVLLTIVAVLLFPLVAVLLDVVPMAMSLRELSWAYLSYVAFGLPAFLLFSSFRSYADGHGHTKPVMWISFIGILINIPTNYVFINGLLGMPKLGGAGCGLATAIVNWSMLLMLVWHTTRSKTIEGAFIFARWPKPAPSAIMPILKIGLPIALALFFEVSLFACIPLMIAELGATEVAGHQVAMNYTALVFMLPMSLAMACTIRVGHLLGQGHAEKLRVAVKTHFGLGVAVAVLIALFTYFARHHIAQIYTQSPDVLALATAILVLACFYQVSDAIQVIAAGVLRGMKQTKRTSIITFVAYWLIGFSVGFVLARTDWLVPAMGARGFWVGIILGLTVAALLLAIEVKRQLRLNSEASMNAQSQR